MNCAYCHDNNATCIGTYEGGDEAPACDECCGHGCEDGKCELLLDRVATLRTALEQARTALAFASSVIQCGEPWTPTCEEMIGGALLSCCAALGGEGT